MTNGEKIVRALISMGWMHTQSTGFTDVCVKGKDHVYVHFDGTVNWPNGRPMGDIVRTALVRIGEVA